MNCVLYGIPHCDTVKKARAFLSDHAVEHWFHDFKKQGVPVPELDQWIEALGWEALLNRKGTTWRQLDAARQVAVCDAASARALMLEQPSVIRRPVLWAKGRWQVGFDPVTWRELLA